MVNTKVSASFKGDFVGGRLKLKKQRNRHPPPTQMMSISAKLSLGIDNKSNVKEYIMDDLKF